MREIALRVPAEELEQVLDAILPTLPGGLHLRESGGTAELRIAASPHSPGEDELRDLAGDSLLDLRTSEVSDDWRQRRLARYEPLVIADRFLVRPDWAPPGGDPRLTEVVLEQGSSFGTGVHPTTQACLAMLAELAPAGSFADYGCGSAVLSLAAAQIGFAPVVAVDASETAVSAARRNAARNRVELDVRLLDLATTTPPAAETVFANVPPAVHVSLAPRLRSGPARAVVSGFHANEIASVTSAWGALGLAVADEVRANEWVALLLR